MQSQSNFDRRKYENIAWAGDPIGIYGRRRGAQQRSLKDETNYAAKRCKHTVQRFSNTFPIKHRTWEYDSMQFPSSMAFNHTAANYSFISKPIWEIKIF